MSRPCESCKVAAAVELVYAAALCAKCAKAERALIADLGIGRPKTLDAAPEVFNLALVDARAESVETAPEPILSQPSLF